MRRAVTTLSVMAMVLLAATAAFAAGQQISLDNGNSDPIVWGGTYANWNSPTATTGGALWLKTGSGPAVQYPYSAGDINIQFLIQAPAPYGWTTMATLLLSDHTADGDMTAFGPGYDGFFFDLSGNAYEIPGTNNFTGPYNHYNARLYFWTGNYNTYADALTAATAHTPGVYVADSGVFNQSVPYGSPPPIPGDVSGMPATIMSQPVPEPSTLLLVATGLLGLLAYAWRKRK
jgi:hypothetical protein